MGLYAERPNIRPVALLMLFGVVIEGMRPFGSRDVLHRNLPLNGVNGLFMFFFY